MKQFKSGEDFSVISTLIDENNREYYTVALYGTYHYRPLNAFYLPEWALLSGTMDLPLGVVMIINAHLRRGRDLLLCQDELIEKGYETYAVL